MRSDRSYNGEEEFLRAYWDQIADIQSAGDILVESGNYLSRRRGIVRVYWEVYRLTRIPGKPVPLCRYDAEYPNSSAKGFCAFLFASATKLAHMYSSVVAEEERASRSKEG
jgi:hypothetical protein